MKECNKCKQTKAISEYHKWSKGKNGLDPSCKTCKNQYQKNLYANSEKRKLQIRDWDRKRTQEMKQLVLEIKFKKGCRDCGITNPIVLEFDHLRDKEFGIAKHISKGASLSKLRSEIEKCEVVCANCHRIRTHNRRVEPNGGKLFAKESGVAA